MKKLSCLENNPLSPSPLVGEGGGEGETYHDHPHLNPRPSRGRTIVGKFSFLVGDVAGMKN